MKFRFYLASIYQRRSEMKEYTEKLEAMGHIVTSRWIKEDFDDTDWYHQTKVDIQDIDACDVFVVFTEEKGTMGRGGKDYEAGYAFGKNKPSILVGPVQHQFYTLYTPKEEDEFYFDRQYDMEHMDTAKDFLGWAEKVADLDLP